jgi:hypothetical protein
MKTFLVPDQSLKFYIHKNILFVPIHKIVVTYTVHGVQ